MKDFVAIIWRRKKLLSIGAVIIVLFVFYVLCINQTRQIMREKYRSGVEKINDGYYQEGIAILSDLGDYRDSLALIEESQDWISFENAKSLLEKEEFESARNAFMLLGSKENFEGAEKAKEYVIQIDKTLSEISQKQEEQEKNAQLYEKAQQFYQNGEYMQAMSIFEDLGSYEDSAELAEECSRAVKVLSLSTTLCAGTNASAGVTEAGTIAFSGEKVLTPIDVKDWDDIVSVSIKGSLAIGLKMDGTVCIGGEISGYRIDTSTWNDIIAISAGDLYVVGLREDGSLVAQGHNGDGQVNISDWSNIKAIATGWRHTVGLDNEGNVHIVGISSEYQMNEIEKNKTAWSNIVAIAAGGSTEKGYGDSGHTVGLRSDHTVVAVGDNDQGQCNVSSEEWTNIIAISAGAFHTVGLKADGTVVTTQTGEIDPDDRKIYEEINSWRDIVAVAAGYGFTLGLKSDGTVVGVGYYLDGQRNTDNWEKIVYREEWKCIFEWTDW